MAEEFHVYLFPISEGEQVLVGTIRLVSFQVEGQIDRMDTMSP